MDEIAFAAYLLETLLHEVFYSKRRMARELDVTLRTLQLNMKAGENSKGANRATLGAVFYCCEHRIDILNIYAPLPADIPWAAPPGNADRSSSDHNHWRHR